MGKNRIIQTFIFSLMLAFTSELTLSAQTNVKDIKKEVKKNQEKDKERDIEKEFYEKFKKTKININFKSSDIDDVIKIFADKMNVNIMRRENVKAKITANIKNMHILDVLDVVCKNHGMNYLIEKPIASDPYIQIYTQKDYLKALIYNGTALVIKLKYTKAADVYKKLQDSGAVGKGEDSFWGGIFYADEQNNSIIIVDKNISANKDKLKQVIEAFDQPIPQVLIEAKILSVGLSDSSEYGIDWNLIWKEGTSEEAVVSMPFAGDKDTDFSISKSWKLKDKSGIFSGLVTALSHQGDVKVLSNPRIVVLNNEDAKIIEGKNEPYEMTIIVPSSGESIIQKRTEFIEVGIGITVTPQINQDNVILKIKPSVSSAAERDKKDIAPTVTKSEAETVVSIKNKETLILGGLIQTRQEKVVKKIPLLGSIPLLGYLFSSRSWVTKRSELVIFLTPTIITGGMATAKDIDKLKKVEKEFEDK